MIVVISRFRVKPGTKEKVADIVAKCLGPTRREDGCMSYELMSPTDDPNAFAFVETWRDKDALRAHLKTPHVAAMKSEREQYMDGAGKLTIYEAIESEL